MHIPRRPFPHRLPCAFTALLCALSASLLLTSVGCDYKKPVEQGVVARVNDAPIFLHELEAAYDIEHLSWSGGPDLTVGAIRQGYSRVLSDLIVRELVAQELAARNLAVTDEELNRAEAAARVDYPQGDFEKALVEAYIDIDQWREHLRGMVARRKFIEEVLRPGVRLDDDEVEAYYKANRERFRMPARIHFELVSGPSREQVTQAMELLRRGGAAATVHETVPRVSVQRFRLRVDRLPPRWRERLETMQPGEVSEVTASQVGYEALILEEQLPADDMDVSRAYAQVEALLLRDKLQAAFRDWLQTALQHAEISVSAQLTPRMEAQDELIALEGGDAAPAVYWSDNATDPTQATESSMDETAGDEEDMRPDALPSANNETTAENATAS